MINKNEIHQKYPLAYKQLEIWMENKIHNSVFNQKSKEEQEIIKGMFSMEMIVSILFSSTDSLRQLYCFFDSFNIYMVTDYRRTDNSWQLEINGLFEVISKTNRIEAEEEGFKRCFEVLNEKLK